MIIKPIPGLKGIFASDTGRIFNSKGKELEYYKDNDGYLRVAVKRKNKSFTTGVHRLVALAFIPCDKDVTKLHVNHIDTDKLNNVPTNLEWVTPKLNNIHAALFKGSKHRPMILGKSPEEKYEFISDIHVASRMFNCDIEMVWFSIRDNVPLNGWVLSYLNNSSPIPKELRKTNFPEWDINGKRGRLKPKGIKVKDIFTQEIKEFSSITSAGEFFNCSGSHIYQCLSLNGKVRLFKRKYLVVYDYDDFPVVTQEDYEELNASGGKEVVAFNVQERRFYIYPSASAFIKENKLSKKAVTVDLKKSRLREKTGWWYTYNCSENVDRLKHVLTVQGYDV